MSRKFSKRTYITTTSTESKKTIKKNLWHTKWDMSAEVVGPERVRPFLRFFCSEGIQWGALEDPSVMEENVYL